MGLVFVQNYTISRTRRQDLFCFLTTETTFNQRFPDALTKASPNQSKLAVVNSTSAFLLVPAVL